MKKSIVIFALSLAFLAAQEFERVDLSSLGIDSIQASPAILDYNSDGYIDFWAGYAYLNDGTGRFLKLSSSKGDWKGGGVACWADYNSDGYPDALTVRISWINVTPKKDTCFFTLYENSGPPDYALVDVSEEVGLGFPILDRQPNCPAWLDYDSDGLLDFYYSGYEFVPLNSEDDYPYWSGHEDYLFHNTGSGFVDVSETAGIREGGADTLCSRGVSVGDFDSDGDADIFVSVYRLQPNLLWRNNGNGTFTDVAEDKGIIGILNQSYYGHNIGAAWGDYNNDGYLDLFTPITHHPTYPGDPTSHLWANSGPTDWTFTDRFAESGMRNTEIGSAPCWADYDNDGDLDLYWVNLYGTPGPQEWLYRNDGNNTFEDVTLSTGLKTWGNHSYGLWADINHDGKLDNYAPYSNTGGSYQIFFINTAERDHWLELDFEGRESNRSGIGTRVTAYCDTLLVMRELAPSDGNGYGSMFIARQHLGLGSHAVIDSLVIRWPRGRIDKIRSFAADRLMRMVEGPPSAPERLVYSHAGDTYIFHWTPSPEGDVRGYRLYRRTGSSEPWQIIADDIPADSSSWVVMLEPPLGEVSVTAFDYCEQDNESPHSPIALGIEEEPTLISFEVSSPASIITCRICTPLPAQLELSIYDPAGRKVRDLASGLYLSGSYQLRWHGTDDEGFSLPRGTYFFRLSVDDVHMLTRRAVLK